MEISKIDKNFVIDSSIDEEGYIFLDAFDPRLALYGVFYEKDKYVRMPSSIAKKANIGVYNNNQFTAGGRIRFGTNSRKLKVQVKWKNLTVFSHMTRSGSSGLMLIANKDDGTYTFMKNFIPDTNATKGFDGEIWLLDGLNNYELYLPLYNDIYSIKLGFKADSTITKGKKYKDIPPILYYGSSITQGGCANRSDNSYQSIIEKENNIDYINLGFSGACLAEDIMAEYIANQKMSVFVYDYDYNAPDLNHLENTHEKLFLKFREIQPNTPVIFISRPNLYTSSSPRTATKRLKIIKKTYSNALKNGDKNVYFIDGRSFFGKDLVNMCTVDGSHPTDFGFYLMAQKINKVLKKII